MINPYDHKILASHLFNIGKKYNINTSDIKACFDFPRYLTVILTVNTNRDEFLPGQSFMAINSDSSFM